MRGADRLSFTIIGVWEWCMGMNTCTTGCPFLHGSTLPGLSVLKMKYASSGICAALI